MVMKALEDRIRYYLVAVGRTHDSIATYFLHQSDLLPHKKNVDRLFRGGIMTPGAGAVTFSVFHISSNTNILTRLKTELMETLPVAQTIT